MTFDPAMNDVSAEALEALGAADETYEAAEAGGLVGPWPADGEYECLFLGVNIKDSPFKYADADRKVITEPGVAIQFVYQLIETPADGNGEIKGAILTIPTNSAVYDRLRPDDGWNNRIGVMASMRRFKTALGYILDRPPSGSLLADVKEANAKVEAGEQRGVMLTVKTRTWKYAQGPKKGGEGSATTDYVNSAFTVTEAPASEA